MKAKWITTLISLSVLVGCGVAQPEVTPQQPLNVQHLRHGMKARLAALDLNDEQKAKIKAIVRKYACDETSPDHAKKQALKAILVKADFDADAFTTAYQDLLDNRENRVARRVAMIAEMRDVLTDEQRAKMAKHMRHKAEKTGHHHKKHHGKLAKLSKHLNLTDAQKDAFKKVKEALKEGREARQARRAARHQAMAAFAETGDQAALTTALLAIKPNVPVAAIANALGSLDLEQRQKLVAMKEAKKAKWCAKDAAAVLGEDKLTKDDTPTKPETKDTDSDDADDQD